MLKLNTLPKLSGNLRRVKEIITILTKYGLANWIKDIESDFLHEWFSARSGERLSDLPFEVRVRKALTELGTTFIKLGQVLSTRPDLVGEKLAAELEHLQSNTPADEPSVVSELITQELGKAPSELFAEFHEECLGSASVGQVHKAVLHSGETVIVKVQHAGIEQTIKQDFEILVELAKLAEKYNPELKAFQPLATVLAFKRTLLHELDFRRECRNLERFAQNFKDDKTVHVPKAYSELSSQRVLTMEKLNGFSVSETERLAQEGLDTQALAKNGTQLFLNMIFRDNFYHADPHPGNIWVLDNGQIALLDCGMVGRLDAELQYELEDLLIALVSQDSETVTNSIIRMGAMPDSADKAALRLDVDDFINEYVGLSIQDLDISAALNEMMRIIRRYHITLPANLALLMRVLIMLESTSRTLDRDFNLAAFLKPYFAKNMLQRYSPEKLLKRTQRSYRDWSVLLEGLPSQVSGILSQLNDGKLDISLEHKRLERSINRLVYSILTASLFLGSCLLLSQRVPPTVQETSILGLLGCGLSFVLGFKLYRGIKKL